MDNGEEAYEQCHSDMSLTAIYRCLAMRRNVTMYFVRDYIYIEVSVAYFAI